MQKLHRFVSVFCVNSGFSTLRINKINLRLVVTPNRADSRRFTNVTIAVCYSSSIQPAAGDFFGIPGLPTPRKRSKIDVAERNEQLRMPKNFRLRRANRNQIWRGRSFRNLAKVTCVVLQTQN